MKGRTGLQDGTFPNIGGRIFSIPREWALSPAPDISELKVCCIAASKCA